ncbi:MAG: hypothetical protein LQ342_004881 [Letrouitia transgressa]|nr:MAG: hypothetical protein LQ342_004881 [Letrouitia transgressa]
MGPSAFLISLLTFSTFVTWTAALPSSKTLAVRGVHPLLAIAPNAKDCNNAPEPKECITAKDALPFINKSFRNYNICSAGQAATIVSLMAFETSDFKYNINHFPPPGNPGQGTRNMQSFEFNKKYAQSIPALKDKVAAAGDDKNAVRALLLANEEYDFGSAAWFLTTQCTQPIQNGLKSGSLEGWKAYITDCVGTTVTEERQEYFDRAVKALGVKGT